MKRSQLLAMTMALTASVGVAAGAQSNTNTMTVRPESKINLAGSSNVHDWTCTSSAFNATIEVASAFHAEPLSTVTKPITQVSVTIPVKSLKCGKTKMDENMYKALKAAEFPEIRYVLTHYDVTPGQSTTDSFSALTSGEITVAGKTVSVEIPITATRLDGGAARGEGSVKVLMTDFGIKPPTALLGTLRTKNEIEISFRVLLDRSTVIALSGQ